MAPKRGGVRGTPAPEALESDSRGACAPLDTFSTDTATESRTTACCVAHTSITRTFCATDAATPHHLMLNAREPQPPAPVIAQPSCATNNAPLRADIRPNGTPLCMGGFCAGASADEAGQRCGLERLPHRASGLRPSIPLTLGPSGPSCWPCFAPLSRMTLASMLHVALSCEDRWGGQ